MRPEGQSTSFRQMMIEIGNSRLRDLREGKKFDESDLQRIYEEMWTILSTLDISEALLTISSARLVELGLVSESAAGEIEQRRARKASIEGEIKPEQEPQNVIVVRREKGGFLLTKTFMSEERYFDVVRRDTIVREEILLSTHGSKYNFELRSGENGVHLHAFGQTWFPNQETVEKTPLTTQEVTSKDIIRTLVTLIEGFNPGCLSI